MGENKVQFNLKNVHYAVLNDPDKPTYAAPVKQPGAVAINLEQKGEVTPFYADGIAYFQAVSNDGYEGDAEFARLLDQMRKDIWGYEETKEKVLLEKADAVAKAFALLFQIDGDEENELYCLYNCTGTRPAISSKTNTGTKEPNTQSTTVSAKPLPNGYVMARTSATTPKEVKENWFKQVYLPTEAAGV